MMWCAAPTMSRCHMKSPTLTRRSATCCASFRRLKSARAIVTASWLLTTSLRKSRPKQDFHLFSRRLGNPAGAAYALRAKWPMPLIHPTLRLSSLMQIFVPGYLAEEYLIQATYGQGLQRPLRAAPPRGSRSAASAACAAEQPWPNRPGAAAGRVWTRVLTHDLVFEPSADAVGGQRQYHHLAASLECRSMRCRVLRRGKKPPRILIKLVYWWR